MVLANCLKPEGLDAERAATDFRIPQKEAGRKRFAADFCPASDVPGLYSEELIVRTRSGAEARDYAQVRVYDRKRGRNMVTGWVYHHPVRRITPGQPVTFWNRLSGTRSDVRVDFGDGTPAETIVENTTHSFGQPGIFTVSFTTSGPDQESASAQMCVVVESADSLQGRPGS